MKIQLKRSNVLESGNAKVPTSAQLDYGELAVNYNANDPTLFLKDSDDNVIKFGGTSAYDDRYVQRAGDNMTGDLTFGTDGAATPNITLDATGSGTFAGSVLSTSYSGAGQQPGYSLASTGALILNRAANQPALRIFTEGAGSTLPSITLDSSGSATFKGIAKISTESASPVSGGAKGVEINPTGRVTCAKPSGSAESDQVFSGFAVGNSSATTKIFSDGSAEFAGHLVAGKVSNDTKYFRWRDSDGVTIYDNVLTGGSELFKIISNDTASLKTQVSFAANGSAFFSNTIRSNSQIRCDRFKCGDNADQDRIELSAGGSIYGADGDFQVANEGNNGARMQIKRSAGSDAFVIMDMSGTPGVQLKVGGTSTFRSTIQTGYFNTTSTGTAGCLVGATGQIDVQRTSSQGNSFLFRGWQGTSNTCWIRADGSASFKSITVDGGSVPEATNAEFVKVGTDSGSNATRYISFVSATGTGQSILTDTALTYNPATDTIGAGNFNSTSDIALKQDITSIDGALSRLSNIEGVGFAWKKTGARTYGVIAQDVEKEFPELVHTEEFKSVNYNGLVGVLIEAIKELKAEVEELKKG